SELARSRIMLADTLENDRSSAGTTARPAPARRARRPRPRRHPRRGTTGRSPASVVRLTGELRSRSAGRRPLAALPGALLERERTAVVEHLERLALEELVDRLPGADVDAQAAAAVGEPEAEPCQLRRETGREGQRLAVVSEAAEAGDGDQPGAGERGEVQAVGGVGVDVVQV